MKSGKKKKQNRSNGKNGKGVASIFGKNLTENGIGNAQEKKRNRKNVGCQRLEKGKSGKFQMSIVFILQDKKFWRLFVQQYN